MPSSSVSALLCPVAVLLLSGSLLFAQTPAGIEQKFNSEYSPTQTTADHSDIVTAGAIFDHQKEGLLMIAAISTSPVDNTYKDGKISQNMWKMSKAGDGI